MLSGEWGVGEDEAAGEEELLIIAKCSMPNAFISLIPLISLISPIPHFLTSIKLL
ncbi:hypothetical protein [Nostoc commune]|uniref:hypothetical protein n=1 Tax=Nostoc commune TaxID=1178 RepID=UPI0015E811B9|nr:hypothetical protein [Nostoc commune]